MTRFCAVIGCANRAERDKKCYYRIPAAVTKGQLKRIKLSRLRRLKWIIALRRANITENKMKYLLVCEDHFISGKPAHLFDVDNPDWVPAINMGYDNSDENSKIAENWLNEVDNNFLFELSESRKKRSSRSKKGSKVSVTSEPIILSVRPAKDPIQLDSEHFENSDTQSLSSEETESKS